ncbi:MAG: hypothetical protein WCG21_08620 [Eubacteriales bacterium]
MDFETNITKILNEIIEKRKLPANSIYLNSNVSSKGKHEGKLISNSLCISEPEYPVDPQKKKSQNKSYVIMNIKNQKNIELLIRNKQYADVLFPSSATLKELKSDKIYKHIVFERDNEDFYEYLKANVNYCLDNYKSSNSFGCCSRYEECSAAMTCLHENKLYSTGCYYRKNLDSGRIFYGVNRNV